MTYFPKYSTFFNLQETPKFPEIFNKTADVKMRGNFQYFGSFKVLYVWLGCSTLYKPSQSLIGAKMSKYG